MVNKIVVGSDVNVHAIEVVENTIIRDIIGNLAVKIASDSAFDPAILFQLFLVVSKYGDPSLAVVLSYELSSHPVAFFEAKNILYRSGNLRFAHLRGTNILVKNVNARVFTDGAQRPILKPHLGNQFLITSKTAPPLVAIHVIQLTGTIFELNSCIKKTNVLTKFHKNWAKNVKSRLAQTNQQTNQPTDQQTGQKQYVPHYYNINKTYVLTNFHDDWENIVTSRVFTRKTTPPTGGHVFHRTKTTFEHYQHIIKANIFTKFYENLAKNATSRVLTYFHYIHMEKNAPPTGGHVF
ncbi:hypothetical protein DPMN_044075 [Dreissena polymorpha]|uniref:Uncharacterized protein n=1 Tax=Dreissena polymorpha TaxID=45954 RepID=A0A9D4HYK3_DREPO|nr:hypothetical protein DPMN_044075 [Dreissena polymorpha]